MGAQGNAERREKSLNTRLIFLLVYLVLRLSVTSTAKQSYEVERAIRAKEREEAQLAEAQSAWDEAMLVQAQVTPMTARPSSRLMLTCARWRGSAPSASPSRRRGGRRGPLVL